MQGDGDFRAGPKTLLEIEYPSASSVEVSNKTMVPTDCCPFQFVRPAQCSTGPEGDTGHD
jgi:hypothetical protein